MTEMDDRLDEYSDRVLAKASDLVRRKPELLVRDPEHPTVFEVRDQYRVQVGEGGHCTCTCPHGMNHVPAYCYHTAAVLLRLRELGEDVDAHPTPDDAEEGEPDFSEDFEELEITLTDEDTKD